MSDKQKGLINAVKAAFPESEHRFCVRHTNNNLLIKDHIVVVKQDVTFGEVTLKCPNPSPWI
jgi:hypothetical protein